MRSQISDMNQSTRISVRKHTHESLISKHNYKAHVNLYKKSINCIHHYWSCISFRVILCFVLQTVSPEAIKL